MKQCEATQSWPTKNSVISPIISLRNRPNPYGITHKYGKKAGQVKKYKLITQKDIDNAEAEVSNG